MPGGPPTSAKGDRPAPAASDFLLPDEWRGPGARANPPTAKPRRATRAPSDPLHLRARAAAPAEERARARDVIAAAKSAVVDAFDSVRFGKRLDIARLAPVVEGIAASIARDPIAIPSVTRLKSRHEYTYLHSVAVCGLMIALARELDLDEALTYDIGLAGLLHDVGKARVPNLLLDKAGPLTPEEFTVMRSHTERGVELLVRAGGVPDIALDVCAHHHERVDGSGYPFRLVGSDISIYARMGAICDVYDAVTSERSYKKSWSPGEALEWMSSTNGHFDRIVLSAFVKTIGVFPIGSLVRLQSDRLAVVLDDVEAEPINPSVCAFYCAHTRRPLPWQRFDGGTDPIVGIERPERWPFSAWGQVRDEILAHFARPLAQ